MKKNIIKALFISATMLTGGLLMNSCNDSIDIVQDGESYENQITTVTQLTTYLTGSVYNLLEPSNANYLTAVITDELAPGIGSGGQEFQLHRFFIDSNDTYTASIWSNNYLVINRVNHILKVAEQVKPANAAEQTTYNKALAQARAIRAYCYLQLETYFSTDMKNENALGVMWLEGAPVGADIFSFSSPRISNKAIYDRITADLDYARGILPYMKSDAPSTNNPALNSDSRFYASKDFVNAVAARFNLYRGNYALAKQYAQDVMSNVNFNLTVATPMTTSTSGAIGSSSWNTAWYSTSGAFNPYRQMWGDLNRGEIIFALNRLPTGAGAAIGTYYNTNSSSITGAVMWFWGKNLYNAFNVNGDVRKYAYLDPSSNPYLADNYFVIDKFPGKPGAATRNDVKVFRLSEMQFILAEAAVEEGNFAQAATYVNNVRTARAYSGTPVTPAYANKQAAYADILKERRVELALEGHRYIDLKRLATTAGVTMDRDLTADDYIPTSNLPNNSYKYTLPIPLAELTGNPAMAGQQNPGY
ncbi:RagB/SusD family nutrient uptake outer membrane protein [Chryseobacterium lactis]|uniref:RagB/SusD family nutrient uptake outer membrane protein n=1 Tax=Chryseobacterium lactis TaxID=1241981 RepID=UPI0016260D7E|nr:RagB/SusD family nutrient uptake outer membrane protein [Chryseobacterium lactis]